MGRTHLSRNEQIGHDMDTANQRVMPPTWIGHARMVINSNEDLSFKQRKMAMKVAETLLNRGNYSAESVGKLAVKKVMDA